MSTTRFFQFALRFFMLFSILFVPRIVLAQDTASYCEAPPAVQQALEKLSAVYDEDMPYKLQRERQIAMLEELLKTHPDNFHLKRRYQDIRLTGFFIDKAALRDEYRAQMEKNPNDPAAVYLYARLLVGRETKQAIELATKLTQQAPAFPWAHLYVQKLRERLKDRKDVVVITQHRRSGRYGRAVHERQQVQFPHAPGRDIR